MNFRLITRAMTLLLALISFIGALAAMLNILEFHNKWSVVVISSVFAALITAYLSYFLRTIQKNPTPLRVGLVGLPGSGKTVFLSVLFHEIQSRKNEQIAFQPYGRETVEEVTRNINTLAGGKWLSTTGIGSVFPFRANARVSTILFPRRYTVEIGDYAGEHINEFDSTSPQWLHRTKYFEYITGSDILFLAIDGHRIAFDPLPQLEQTLNNLIASFQVLLDEKGLQPGRKTSMPVGILILKSDCLGEKDLDKEAAFKKISRLVSLCANRCHRSQVFFVSAVGAVGKDGAPPSELHPRNVYEPILWALESPNL